MVIGYFRLFQSLEAPLQAEISEQVSYIILYAKDISYEFQLKVSRI